MKKKKLLTFGIPATAFLAAAGLLLAGSAVGSTRAALNIYSDEYQSVLDVPELKVELQREEKDGGYKAIEGSALLSGAEDEEDAEAVIGKEYGEKLRVSNTGDLDSYVRVRIYKSWADEKGAPIRTLSPELINLKLNLEGSGWAVGEESDNSEEMTVLYYMKPLAPGAPTPDFMEGYQISYDIWKKVNANGFAYGGTVSDGDVVGGPSLKLEVEVDSVQTVGGSEAIMSAWGRPMSVADDGSLSFGGYRGSGWDVPDNSVSDNDVSGDEGGGE